MRSDTHPSPPLPPSPTSSRPELGTRTGVSGTQKEKGGRGIGERGHITRDRALPLGPPFRSLPRGPYA